MHIVNGGPLDRRQLRPPFKEARDYVLLGGLGSGRSMSASAITLVESDYSDAELDFLAEAFKRDYTDNGVADDLIKPDFKEVSRRFVMTGRDEHKLAVFKAVDGDAILGVSVCQIWAGSYPIITRPARRCYGYIWGVFVLPEARRKGYGRALTQQAVNHLKALGCSRVLLHATPMGLPVYERMGFIQSNEMKLDIGTNY